VRTPTSSAAPQGSAAASSLLLHALGAVIPLIRGSKTVAEARVMADDGEVLPFHATVEELDQIHELLVAARDLWKTLPEATDDAEARIVAQMLEIRHFPGEQIIDRDHGIPVAEKGIAQVRAEKPGSACDEHALWRGGAVDGQITRR